MNAIDNIYKVKNAFNSPVSIMVGAGLSVPQPSELPLQRAMVKSLMNLDWFRSDEMFKITDNGIIDYVSKNIRLEHIFSIFYEWWQRDPGKLIAQFKTAKPNWYHYKIAQLVAEGVVKDIFTTNFDVCLEQALTIKEINYKQVTEESDIPSDDFKGIKVVKLHGSSSSHDGSGDVRGLIATLEALNQGIQVWKAKLLNDAIDRHGLVCMGYSGADFDINPVLREKLDRNIVWVNHTPESNNVEITHTLQFSNFKEPVTIDTTAFLGEETKLEPSKKNFQFNVIYTMDDYLHPSCFLGRLLEYCNNYAAARDYYIDVFQRSTGSKYLMIQIIDIARSIVVCNYELGEYSAAEIYVNICKALIETHKKNLETEKRILLDFDNVQDSQKELLLDFAKDQVLQEELLLSEEVCLLYNRLGYSKKFFEEEGALFKIIQECEKNKILRTSDRSRLLLNFSSIYLRKARNGDVFNIDYYTDLEDSLLMSEKLKNDEGDLHGLAKAIMLLIDFYFLIGQVDFAKKKIQAYIPLDRKLRDPVTAQYTLIIVELASTLLIRKYHNCDAVVTAYDDYKKRVRELMFNELPPERVVEDTLWEKMAADTVLNQLTQKGGR